MTITRYICIALSAVAIAMSSFGSIYSNDMAYVLGGVKQAFIQDKISTEAQVDNLLLGFNEMGVNGIRVPIFAEGLEPNKPMLDYFIEQAVAQGFLIFANPAQHAGGQRIALGILAGDLDPVYDDPVATATLINRIIDFAEEYPCTWINPFNEDGSAGGTWSINQINTIYSTLSTNLNGAALIGPGVWGIPGSITVLENTDILDYVSVATTHNLGFNHSRWPDFIALADARGLPVWDSEVNHHDKYGTGTRLEAALANQVDGLVLYNSWTTISLTDGSINSSARTLRSLCLKPSSLVANWSMNQESGTTVPDDSGSGFDGVATHAAWADGMDGNALLLNGSNSLVTIPATAFGSMRDEVSIAMWVYGGAAQPSDDSVLYAVDAAGERIFNIHLPWGNTNVYWDVGDGDGYDRISKTASSSLFKDSWNHWVFTKDAAAGTMKIYVNGALWHSGTGKTKVPAGITSAAIGTDMSGAFYDGRLDDIRLYNYALSTNDVTDLYRSYPYVEGADGISLDGIAGDGAGGYTLSFSVADSVLSHNYRIEGAENLITPDWQFVSGVYSGNGGGLQIELPMDSGKTNLFYRLEAWRQ